MSISVNLLSYFGKINPTIRNRGLDIFKRRNFDEIHFDKDFLMGEYIVDSDSGKSEYHVHFQLNNNGQNPKFDCNCPYEEKDCKHSVAVLLALIEKTKEGKLEEKNEEKQQPIKKGIIEKGISIPFDKIDIDSLIDNPEFAKTYSTVEYVDFMPVFDPKERSIVFNILNRNNRKSSPIKFTRTDWEHLTIECFCNASKMPCVHTFLVFKEFTSYNHSKFGGRFFDKLMSPEAQKKRILAEYGYDIENEKDLKLFSFSDNEGLISGKPKDQSLLKVSQFQSWEKKLKGISIRNNSEIMLPMSSKSPKAKVDLSMGYIIEAEHFRENKNKFALYPVVCKPGSDGVTMASHIKHLDDADVQSLPPRDEADEHLILTSKSLSDKEFDKAFKSKFGVDVYLNLKKDEHLFFELQFYYERLLKAIEYLPEKMVAFSNFVSPTRISKGELTPVKVSTKKNHP